MKIRNAVAGISGGRTSARMSYLLDASVVLSFQNTGKEAKETYEFIERLEQDLQRPIIRLEYRAPTRGEAPKHSTFEVVEHRHLSRRGGPFLDLLECMASYRAKHKGLGPVAPWANSRICTAYLKVRTQRKYCASLGWGDAPYEYTEYIGLRADEPPRLAKMRGRNQDRGTDEQAPLADLGITKPDILNFWANKPFDLGCPEWMGNCTGCFLKDERDLASALNEDQTDPEWWFEIERNYGPMRRGGRPSYQQVFDEIPARMAIRKLVNDQRPVDIIEVSNEFGVAMRRVKLIVRQEQTEAQPFSCECDAAKNEDFDDQLEFSFMGGN